MRKRFHSIFRKTMLVENRLHSALLRGLSDGHPCRNLTSVQIQLLFEVSSKEPVSLKQLVGSVHLSQSLAEVHIRKLVDAGLVVQEQNLYRVNSGVHEVLVKMEQDFDGLATRLGFRVGELALIEWDHILTIIDREMDLLDVVPEKS